jgi:hypothetical protein
LAYDPSITQRVRKAVKEATDQFLAVDVLLEHNERQDKLIGEIQDDVKDLKWHNTRRITEEYVKKQIEEAFRFRDQKMSFLTKVVWIALVPVSMAAGGFFVTLLGKH